MSAVSLRVKVGTVRFRAGLPLPAGMHLVVERVVLLLLPSMRESTSILVPASIRISLNEMFRLPLRALLSFIVEDMRLPPKVLPIMCVHAGIPSMGSITIRAPNSFEMKHVEISSIVALAPMIFIMTFAELVQEIHSDLFFRMCESTHISIVARFDLVRVALAEFDLVLLWVIKFLNSVVSPSAAIPQVTVVPMLCRDHIAANL